MTREGPGPGKGKEHGHKRGHKKNRTCARFAKGSQVKSVVEQKERRGGKGSEHKTTTILDRHTTKVH